MPSKHLLRELVKYDLPSFIGKTLETVNPAAEYFPNWHIDLIAEYLEAAQKGKIKRLIINLPPRSLKSICVSVAWPAWLLGHNPQSRIIAASYASSLSTKHSVDCRMVMNSGWYNKVFPHTRLSHDQNEKHKFVTTQRGHRIATSIDGNITGEGANFLIIDDPISPAHVLDEARRQNVNQWFDHTFSTRLDDKKNGVIVMVMQRLHPKDLTDYLMKKGGWHQLSLPAVAAQRRNYSFGRVRKIVEAGEILHAAREDKKLIDRAKVEMGSAAFAAQYQQQPLAGEGGMIKPQWIQRYEVLPEKIERYVQSWDTAIKGGKEHDASVCLTFAEAEGKSYLCDARCVRFEYPDLKRMVYMMAELWKPHAILIEDKASGQQLLQDIRREGFLPLIGRMPKASKIIRMASVSALIEAGKLIIPNHKKWLFEFESELFSFPDTTHDDHVDALVQYLEWQRESQFNALRVRKI